VNGSYCYEMERPGCVTQGGSKSVKKLVLSRAREIYRYVKVEELIPELVNPELSFVTQKELEKLHKINGDSRKARELLVILNKKGSIATCKFMACLLLEPEHSGHQELAQELMKNSLKVKGRESKTSSAKPLLTQKEYVKLKNHCPTLSSRVI
jgi:hypothetical protein